MVGPHIAEQELSDSRLHTDESYVHYRNVRNERDLCLVQFGHHITPQKYGYGPMMRDHYLLHFVKSGRGRLFIHEDEYHIRGGQVFFIYPYQIAYYEADEADPWEYYWIGFAGLRAEALMQQAGFSYRQNALPMHYAGQVFIALKEMLAHIAGQDNMLLLEGLMQIVLYHITRPRPQGAESAGMPPVVRTKALGRKAEEYVRIITSIIQTSFGEQISVEEIAGQLGLNRSYLTELFKRYTGMSIKQYLTNYRISKSRMFLKDSKRSVKDVALETGFSDPLYFSRLFKRYEGISPQEYREALAQG